MDKNIGLMIGRGIQTWHKIIQGKAQSCEKAASEGIPNGIKIDGISDGGIIFNRVEVVKMKIIQA